MLMKVKPIDWHEVQPEHKDIHDRLENWARYVGVRHPGWVSPIWKMGKSHGRQWHAPDLRPAIDTLDGHVIEKAVASLPDKQRDAIRWSYVYRTPAAAAVRNLAVTYDRLEALVRSGRTMLKNTCTENKKPLYNRAQSTAQTQTSSFP